MLEAVKMGRWGRVVGGGGRAGKDCDYAGSLFAYSLAGLMECDVSASK